MSKYFQTTFCFLLFLLSNHKSMHKVATAQGETEKGKWIESFCAGEFHGCAVFDSKLIKCWGLASSFGASITGNIGDSREELGNNLPYVNISNAASAIEVSCGSQHTCVRLDSGDMKCLGSNDFYQIGIGSTLPLIGNATGFAGDMLPKVNLGNSIEVFSIALGDAHTCALVTRHRVKCFGHNNYGQLGYENKVDIGGSASQMGNALPFLQLGTNVEASSLYVGSEGFHSCIIISAPEAFEGRIKCWGYAFYYQLGYGDRDNIGDDINEMGDNLPLVDLGSESKVMKMALGCYHTCAILVNGKLKCWGFGASGRLGLGSTDTIKSVGDSMPFVLIDSKRKINHITAGLSHTCIGYEDNLTLKCFGYNWYGQLGQGDTLNRADMPTSTTPLIPPVNFGVQGLNITTVHAGGSFTCVVFSDSSVKCFGNNMRGQLLIGSTLNIGDAKVEMGQKLKFSKLFATLQLCGYPASKACSGDSMCYWAKVGKKQSCMVLDCASLTKPICSKQKGKCLWASETRTCNMLA